jgi:hypothetical protein
MGFVTTDHDDPTIEAFTTGGASKILTLSGAMVHKLRRQGLLAAPPGDGAIRVLATRRRGPFEDARRQEGPPVMRLAADVGGLPSFAGQLKAARLRDPDRHFFGEVECYCEWPGCAVREVTIRLKELDAPGRAVTPQCPLCKSPMKTHHVLTSAEAARAARREARSSVNEELWRRNHPDALCVPLNVLLDERLPGTDDVAIATSSKEPA